MINNVAFFSECGTRDVNQDAIYASAQKNRGIFVVADGMGGHSGGEIASSVIINGIRNWWNSNDFMDMAAGMDEVAEQCTALLHNINMEVFAYFSAKGQVGGSTVAVLIIWDDRYTILSAGDSRVYRFRKKILEQLTADDVWENLPEVKYEMSREKIVCDPRIGKLTQALGSEGRLKIDRSTGILSKREVFLLCSDGVYKHCTRRELEQIMCKNRVFRSMERTKKMIRKYVEKSGADDNYSAVICSVKRTSGYFVN